MKLQVVKVDTTWYVVNSMTNDVMDYVSWEAAMISANRRVTIYRTRQCALNKANSVRVWAIGRGPVESEPSTGR